MFEMRIIGWHLLKSSYIRFCRCNDFRCLTTLASINTFNPVKYNSKSFCTDKKHFFNAQKNVRELQNVIEHNKDILRETEQRIRAKSSDILRDIRTTKERVKERMEEVIEVKH